MDKSLIAKLTREASVTPELQDNDNIYKLRDNVKDTIRAVKRRLGLLQTLEAEIDFEITLNHLDDEEP
jgi:hypothetical protein